MFSRNCHDRMMFYMFGDRKNIQHPTDNSFCVPLREIYGIFLVAKVTEREKRNLPAAFSKQGADLCDTDKRLVTSKTQPITTYDLDTFFCT